MKRITLWDQGRLSRKKAMMIGVTRADRYRQQDTWHPLGHLPHYTRVDAVTHYTRHTMEIGDEIVISGLDQKELMHIRLTGIRLVLRDQLTTKDIQAIGFDDLDEFAQTWDLGDKRLWFYEFEQITIHESHN